MSNEIGEAGGPAVDREDESQSCASATTEHAQALRVRRLQHDKQVSMYALLGLFVAGGFIEYFLVQDTDAYKTYKIFSVVLYAAAYMRWFVLDARQHNYRISRSMFMCLVAASILAAPFYFYGTRGKAAWRALLRVVGFALCCGVASAVGEGIGYMAVLLHAMPAPPAQ